MHSDIDCRDYSYRDHLLTPVAFFPFLGLVPEPQDEGQTPKDGSGLAVRDRGPRSVLLPHERRRLFLFVPERRPRREQYAEPLRQPGPTAGRRCPSAVLRAQPPGVPGAVPRARPTAHAPTTLPSDIAGRAGPPARGRPTCRAGVPPSPP